MKKLLHILWMSALAWQTGAQDPNFSHFFSNTQYYNPAATAIHSGFRACANTRFQWTHVPSNFNTAYLGIETQALNKTGLGLSFLSNSEGEGRLRTNNLMLYYSYRPIETRNFQIQAGFQSGIVQKRIDFTKFVFSDQLDEVYGNINGTAFIPPANDRIFYPDFGAGVMAMLNSPNHMNKDLKLLSTLGFAAHHITMPRDEYFNTGGKLPIKWVLNAGTNIFYHDVVYAPALIWERQGPFSTFSIGMNAVRQPIYAGFWFRNRTIGFKGNEFDSFIFNIGSNFSTKGDGRLKFGYAYDFTISRLRTSTYGTHELTLIYEYDDYILFAGAKKRKADKHRSRFLKCVKGF